jgi:hypothetical protein
MFKINRLTAIAAVVGALAAAGPVAGASASTTAPTTANPGSSVPCYPFPAFCDPTTGKPAAWAPAWVSLALGLPPTNPWPVLTFPQPPTFTLATPVIPAG